MDRLKILTKEEFQRQKNFIGQEVLQKENRPYYYVTIKINNVNWAIPLRSHIGKRPKITYWEVTRTENHIEGLDFSKALIVNDNSFDNSFVRISSRKRKYIHDNYKIIEQNFNDYINLVQKIKDKNRLDIDSRTKFSTIKTLI